MRRKQNTRKFYDGDAWWCDMTIVGCAVSYKNLAHGIFIF